MDKSRVFGLYNIIIVAIVFSTTYSDGNRQTGQFMLVKSGVKASTTSPSFKQHSKLQCSTRCAESRLFCGFNFIRSTNTCTCLEVRDFAQVTWISVSDGQVYAESSCASVIGHRP